MRKKIIQEILDNKIIAIVRGLKPEQCLRLAEALYKGGIKMIEITFHQANPDSFSDTAKSISSINKHFDGKVITGAGTVVTPEQVEMAFEAGAKYIISPNTDLSVIEKTRALDLVSIPGALTPSEVLAAHNAGADFVKIFPASNFGSSYIKAIKAPISHVRLLAVGGINEKNIKEYLGSGAAGVGVGGNLVNKKWIENGEFDKITALAKEYINNMKG
ncbi:MAG TPA: bifunctional 4-hydroxy-2-oxoglutarate aldolase/2-dehydro-3-deoxy-phosphogluconate aldolase [Clostridiaceae bacterium]|nr:bifunctional 4-hydroxy-2-oxoglutarate aldolase/2-dehydro-3-deoxy-phosphogluconate aldolase [Clostridiaceae bacterium]